MSPAPTSGKEAMHSLRTIWSTRLSRPPMEPWLVLWAWFTISSTYVKATVAEGSIRTNWKTCSSWRTSVTVTGGFPHLSRLFHLEYQRLMAFYFNDQSDMGEHDGAFSNFGWKNETSVWFVPTRRILFVQGILSFRLTSWVLIGLNDATQAEWEEHNLFIDHRVRAQSSKWILTQQTVEGAWAEHSNILDREKFQVGIGDERAWMGFSTLWSSRYYVHQKRVFLWIYRWQHKRWSAWRWMSMSMDWSKKTWTTPSIVVESGWRIIIG